MAPFARLRAWPNLSIETLKPDTEIIYRAHSNDTDTYTFSFTSKHIGIQIHLIQIPNPLVTHNIIRERTVYAEQIDLQVDFNKVIF